MKVLMIGLGSIGQRHLRNLRRLYGDSIEILAYRSRGLKRTFSDEMKVLDGVSVETEYHVRSYTNLNEALLENPDIAFITNITSGHIPCAIQAAEKGCHLFLEKPISHTGEGIDRLRKIVEQKGTILFTGFQFRYHPCLVKLKEYLDSEMIGTLISVDIEMGERLEEMHTYENFKDTYMAQKELGGGVILNQQIHELDYMQWLFGIPESVYAISGKNSALPIDVEDFCSSLYSVKYREGILPIYVHSDFRQVKVVRRCKIVGEEGTIEVDLLKNELHRTTREGVDEILKYSAFTRNDMFIEELKDFMESVNGNRKSPIPLEEGVTSLRMALAAKKSGETGQAVKLNDVII